VNGGSLHPPVRTSASPDTGLFGWESVERRRGDGAVDTAQRVMASRPVVTLTEDGGRSLGRAYWLEVVRACKGVVRCLESPAGVELLLFGLRPPLLRFGPGEVQVEADVVRCRYPVLGGVLARRPGGALTLSQVGKERPELRSEVTGFFPRLASAPGAPAWSGALYRHVQSRAHVALSRRFFRRLVTRRPA
jgi:hypothetical protein